MNDSDDSVAPDRAEMERQAVRAVALALPEAEALMMALEHSSVERCALERSALRAVALGLPEAEALIRQLEAGAESLKRR